MFARLASAWIVWMLGASLAFSAFGDTQPVYRDVTKSVDLRVQDLLSRMTLEEKVVQMWSSNESMSNYGATAHTPRSSRVQQWR